MKFDLSAAWNDAIYLLRTNLNLLVPIAGIFFFLPTLIFALSMTEMAEPVGGSTLSQIISQLTEYFQDLAPYIILVSIFAMIGNLAILKLFLSDGNESVGGALKAAIILFIPALIAQFLGSLAVGLGLILLIIPGIYLSGRLALISAVIASENKMNPITAISRSWKLTENNGWWIVLYVLIIALVGGLIQAIISGVLGLILGIILSPEIALPVTSAIDSFFGAALSILMVCVTASIYRQMTGPTKKQYDTVFE